MAQAAEQDDFEAQAAANDATSGYLHTRDADVEDQREYRIIPRGTPCELRVGGFTLDVRKAPCLWAKIEPVAPEEYADGSSNFRVRLPLGAQVGEGKTQSGWDMTARTLAFMWASIQQIGATEAKNDLLGPVYDDFPTIATDDLPRFYEALTARCNETMKGQTFHVTKIGVEPESKGQDGRVYPEKQSFGVFDYPKPEKK